MAFTAAVCSENFMVGLLLFNDQMQSWLSLPPDASWRLSGDHLRPHTSDLCAEHLHHAFLIMKPPNASARTQKNKTAIAVTEICELCSLDCTLPVTTGHEQF